MTVDYRFIKVHNGFPEHRKTAGLSDKAFRHLIEAWCFCSRTMNDGIITKPQARRIFSAKTLQELAAEGWITESAESVEMLDYLGHQMSAAQVADLREKRALAGKLGGVAKAKALASAKANALQDAGKDVPDRDRDRDRDRETTKGVPPRAERGTRIPGDFRISPALRAWAYENVPGMDIDFTTKKFIAHFQAQSGQRGTMINWDAAWKKWMLSDFKPASVAAPQQRGYGRPGERRSLV